MIFPVSIIGVFWLAATLFTGTACLFAAMTGLPCPACGITRASTALFRLDFRESIRFFPLLLPIFIIVVFSFWAKFWKSREFYGKYAAKMQVGLMAAVFIVYIVRMILFFPHTEPMEIYRNGIIPRIIGLFA
ncbi:MAG: DUF2752 domain-containing protein [Oscillospiraceae bacterium]|jgi:hypothetical protein|nr:DUF2752 domain-containing protein [Oscillospiraceae bacterium]